MKKKFKKLNLSTETLSHLTEPKLKQAAGGAITDNTMPCTFCTRACSECTIACSICCL